MKKLNKKDFKLIITASNIVELECLINGYFYSKYYRITDDLMIHNDEKRIELLNDYIGWFIEFNKMFKIFRVKNGYKFYRYYGVWLIWIKKILNLYIKMMDII